MLGLLLVAGMGSCRDEELLPEDPMADVPQEIKDGFSLQFNVTLDNMGGDDDMAGSGLFNRGAKELRDIENYINPEMFRVLFFDKDDYFLFESKSRWVTQKEEIDGGNVWHVSVPVFSYGNDDPDYDWVSIRNSLMTGEFRIAILANRPTWIEYPDLSDLSGGGQKYYYNYPNWDHNDSYKKKIFDLHHCAHDEIYTGKSTKDVANGTDGKNVQGFYDFVFGNDPEKAGKEGTNLMGSIYMCIEKTTEKVDSMQGSSVLKKDVNLNQSIAKLPTKDDPIPMYGVQVFDPLVDWVEGTTYNLSNLEGMYTDYETKNISLLRSLVRCELLVPKSLGKKPTLVAFKYSNIYARTEPMDVSTPTNELWQTDHANCEDQLIREYGPINNVDDSQNADGLNNFYNYNSWFYAIWNTMYGWDWNKKITKNYSKEVDGQPKKYPHLFNPMAQRNKIVYLANQTGVYTLYNSNSTYQTVTWAKAKEAVGDFALVEDDMYWRYVYYTGERAINDQSNLASTTNNNNNKSAREVNLSYWIVSFDDPYDMTSYTELGANSSSAVVRDIRGYEYSHYVLPIIDYSDTSNPFFTRSWTQGGSGLYDNIQYPGKIPFRRTNDEPMQANTAQDYMNYIRDTSSIDAKYLPYPLLRNHVYRLIIRKIGNDNTNGKLDVLTVDSEHLSSPTITFK